MRWVHRDLLSRIALAIAQAAAIGWFSPGRGLPLDDAWIHQVVARTFAETGTLGYTPGAHGAAATSYLWAALLAIGFKIHLLEPSRWALLLNGIATLATGQLLHAILERARPRDGDGVIGPITWQVTSFAAALLGSIAPNMLWLTCSGMEAMPFVALSLTAIWAATGETQRPRRALVAGVAAGALALLRPEAAPLGGLLAFHAFVRRRPQSIAPIVVPWIACVGVYVGSNVLLTSHALPSTLSGRRWLWFEMSSGLSRGDRALEFLDAWTTRLSSYTFDTSVGVMWILLALAAYGALRLVRGGPATETKAPWWRALRDGPVPEDAPRLLFVWALFHAAFYALLLPTPGHGGRYQPLTPLLFATCLPLGAAFVLRELARIVGLASKIPFAWFAVAGVTPWIALAAPIAGSLRHANALAVAHIQATELAAGRFIDTLPEGAVASFDIGGSGFATRRHVLDLGGLSDPKTAALLESGRISTWLEANHVRWIVLPEAYESVLPTFEDYKTKLHIAGNPSLAITPIRAFETPFAQWEPAIRATWNAAPKQVVYEVSYTGEGGPREVALVAPDVLRPIPDPTRLVRPRDRVLAEHMLATLAAWNLPVDLKLVPAPPPRGDATDAAGCTISMGWWGFAVDGCTGAGDPQILRASIYEHAGRYLDVGDIGGALRILPHVVAQNRRRIDPRFHPPLASVMQPLPGGGPLSPMRAGKWGLAVLAIVFASVIAIEALARRFRLGGTANVVPLPRTSSPGVAAASSLMLILTMLGCGPDTDVTEAMARGRGGVEIELAAGGSVDRSTSRAPLLEAASIGDVEILSLLLERGARLDVRDGTGATPLHLAARRGHHAAVAVLAAAMTARAPDKRTALDIPAGPRRRTALHEAALSGSIDAVNALLRAGADANSADSFGQTPLHLLATIDPPRAGAIAALLLGAGADPRIADARGFTPLHAGAAADNVPLVSALPTTLFELAAPAGETALDVALRYGRDRAAETLLAAGASMRHEVWPPLHQAARMDAIDRAALLVGSGADVGRRVAGKTALELAVESGSKRVEAFLRERRPQ